MILVVLELIVNNQVKPHTRGNLTKVLHCKQTTVNSLPVCITVIVILCAHVNLTTYSKSSYLTVKLYIELVSILIVMSRITEQCTCTSCFLHLMVGGGGGGGIENLMYNNYSIVLLIN